jgi:hypothetical protein
MQTTIKTILGDEWIVLDGLATSSNTEKTIGYSEDIQSFLEKATTDVRYANRMRLIEEAPIGLNGKHFLLPDREHEGWLRPIDMDDPVLDWRGQDEVLGPILMLAADHSISARLYVEEPGAYDDCWEISRYIPSEKMYGIIGVVKKYEDVQEYIQKGDFPDPLPPLWTDVTRIIDLQDGYTAEILRSPQNDMDGGITQHFLMNIIDCNGNKVIDVLTGANTILKVRDSSAVMNAVIEQNQRDERELQMGNEYEKSQHKLLTAFKEIKISAPMGYEAFNNALSNLKPNDMLHLETPEKEYELLVTWRPVNSLRTLDGDVIYKGNEIPPVTLFQNWHLDSLVTGKEREYDVHVKRPEGSMIFSTEDIVIDRDTLFKLITNQRFFEKTVEQARSTFPSGLEDPTEQNLIGFAAKGGFFNLEYISKSEVSPKEMQKRIEKQYERAEESYLKMS